MLLMFWKGLSVPAGLGPGALGPLTITSSAVTGRMAIPGAGGIPGNSVLLVTNLNPDVSWKVLYVKSLSGGGIVASDLELNSMKMFILRIFIKIHH